ncbi:hypothetical protein ACE939_00855 [Aquimarina sp. W85]|uniref:hypothetical protein n=1 Tax=Aquimarina rhodophyticola TaxID=3342246 RepID=UPI0036702E4C
MKWSEILSAVNKVLGREIKADEPVNLTDAEKTAVNALHDGFAEKFETEHNKRASATKEVEASNKAIDAFMKEQGIEPAAKEVEDTDEENPSTVLPNADSSLQEKINAVLKDNKQLKASNQKLAADVEKLKILPTAEVPEKIKANMNTHSYKHSATHLFGQDVDYNAFEGRPWNKAAKEASLGNPIDQIKAATDWTDTANIDKLNQDIQNYFRKHTKEIKHTLLDGLEMKKYMKMISGVSDELVWTTLTTGEITQSLKKKYLPKNKAKFDAEKAKVRDIQIDMTFEGYKLKLLEKSYLQNFQQLGIAGSNPYKETFVRYLVAAIMKEARKEDKIVMGRGVYFKDPDRDTPASYMNNFDGLLKHIHKARGVKYRPFKMGQPTEQNIYEYLNSMVEKLPYEIRILPDLQIVCSPYWKRKYNDARELKKGVQKNYDGDIDYVDGFKNIEIVTYDQLEGQNLIYITTKDNEYGLTDKPGEDGFLQFEKNKRDIDVFGDYKLGTFIAMFGRKLFDVATNSYENQLFFSNDVEFLTDTYVPVPADTAIPSLATHHSLVIGSGNTSATNITDFKDATVGQKVYLLGNADSNVSTVKNTESIVLKGGVDFPLANGNLLVLNALPGGKFIEVERKLVTDIEQVTHVQLAADATTADALQGTNFITQANTTPTAFTDIENAVVDEVYTITGGSGTNATTIASGGKFFISETITLTVDKFITVVYNGDQFVEQNRG